MFYPDRLSQPTNEIPATTEAPSPPVLLVRPNFEDNTLLQQKAKEDPLLSRINPAIELGGIARKSQIDPSERVHECLCENSAHKALYEERMADDRLHLFVHVPFPLTDEPNRLRIDPFDSHGASTDIGMRLAYRLHDLKGHEGLGFGAYHIAIRPALALPKLPLLDAIENALKEAGCPTIELQDMRPNRPVGF